MRQIAESLLKSLRDNQFKAYDMEVTIKWGEEVPQFKCPICDAILPLTKVETKPLSLPGIPLGVATCANGHRFEVIATQETEAIPNSTKLSVRVVEFNPKVYASGS